MACIRVRHVSQKDSRQQDRKQIIPLSGDALREELHDPGLKGILNILEKFQGCRKGKEVIL